MTKKFLLSLLTVLVLLVTLGYNQTSVNASGEQTIPYFHQATWRKFERAFYEEYQKLGGQMSEETNVYAGMGDSCLKIVGKVQFQTKYTFKNIKNISINYKHYKREGYEAYTATLKIGYRTIMEDVYWLDTINVTTNKKYHNFSKAVNIPSGKIVVQVVQEKMGSNIHFCIDDLKLKCEVNDDSKYFTPVDVGYTGLRVHGNNSIWDGIYTKVNVLPVPHAESYDFSFYKNEADPTPFKVINKTVDYAGFGKIMVDELPMGTYYMTATAKGSKYNDSLPSEKVEFKNYIAHYQKVKPIKEVILDYTKNTDGTITYNDAKLRFRVTISKELYDAILSFPESNYTRFGIGLIKTNDLGTQTCIFYDLLKSKNSGYNKGKLSITPVRVANPGDINEDLNGEYYQFSVVINNINNNTWKNTSFSASPFVKVGPYSTSGFIFGSMTSGSLQEQINAITLP